MLLLDNISLLLLSSLILAGIVDSLEGEKQPNPSKSSSNRRQMPSLSGYRSPLLVDDESYDQPLPVPNSRRTTLEPEGSTSTKPPQHHMKVAAQATPRTRDLYYVPPGGIGSPPSASNSALPTPTDNTWQGPCNCLCGSARQNAYTGGTSRLADDNNRQLMQEMMNRAFTATSPGCGGAGTSFATTAPNFSNGQWVWKGQCDCFCWTGMNSYQIPITQSPYQPGGYYPGNVNTPAWYQNGVTVPPGYIPTLPPWLQPSSGQQSGGGYPSGGYPSGGSGSGYPSGGNPTSGGYPSGSGSGGGYPSGGYPSGGYPSGGNPPSGGYPTGSGSGGGYPSGGYPSGGNPPSGGYPSGSGSPSGYPSWSGSQQSGTGTNVYYYPNNNNNQANPAIPWQNPNKPTSGLPGSNDSPVLPSDSGTYNSGYYPQIYYVPQSALSTIRPLPSSPSVVGVSNSFWWQLGFNVGQGSGAAGSGQQPQPRSRVMPKKMMPTKKN